MVRPLSLLLLTVFASGVASAYTAEELVAKNVAARGGEPTLAAIRSLRLSGRVRINGGAVELGFVVQVKRAPKADKIRYEAQLQGLTQVQAFDGQQGWQINPFEGRKDPEQLSADDAKGLAEDAADFAGALVDYKARGCTLEYLGTEDVDGTLAHKLRLSRPNGDLTYVYLDPDYFLEIRQVNRRIEHGVPRESVTDYSDYEKVEGIYLPFAQESGPKGSSDRQKVQFEKAEVNIEMPDTQFQMPVKP